MKLQIWQRAIYNTVSNYLESITYPIKLVKKKLINKIGLRIIHVTIIACFIFPTSLKFYNDYDGIDIIKIIGLAFALIILGFIIYKFNVKHEALIKFSHDKIAIVQGDDSVDITYKSIKKLRLDYPDEINKKNTFYLITEDENEYQIIAKDEVYEGLIRMFPEKERYD
tara:strand:+ start:2192 stop:2695 length:504 start_codon:yes stop_codon:yes gene_type:complete